MPFTSTSTDRCSACLTYQQSLQQSLQIDIQDCRAIFDYAKRLSQTSLKGLGLRRKYETHFNFTGHWLSANSAGGIGMFSSARTHTTGARFASGCPGSATGSGSTADASPAAARISCHARACRAGCAGSGCAPDIQPRASDWQNGGNSCAPRNDGGSSRIRT